MNTKKFTEEELDDMNWGDHPTLNKISSTISDQDRWHTYFDVIFEDTSDNTFWFIVRKDGSTEQQEAYEPWGDLIAYQVKPVEKTVIVYEAV